MIEIKFDAMLNFLPRGNVSDILWAKVENDTSRWENILRHKFDDIEDIDDH